MLHVDALLKENKRPKKNCCVSTDIVNKNREGGYEMNFLFQAQYHAIHKDLKIFNSSQDNMIHVSMIR